MSADNYDEDIIVVESTSKSAEEKPQTISPDVIEKLRVFDQALTALEEALKPHLEVPFEQHLERSVLEMARVDIMSMFTISSLSWALTCMKGDDPKSNLALTSELKRTKEYVNRFKAAEERKAAPRINKFAAKAFVRNALWEIPESGSTENNEDDVTSTNENLPKRRRLDTPEDSAEETETIED